MRAVLRLCDGWGFVIISGTGVKPRVCVAKPMISVGESGLKP